MLSSGVTGAGQGIRIEIGDGRLPVSMIASRMRADLRPSASLRTRVRRQGPFAAVVMIAILVRLATMSRSRAAAR